MFDTPTLTEIVTTAAKKEVGNIHTSTPAFIVDFDEDKQSASVQPVLKGKRLDVDGLKENYVLPKITNVPVYFPQGGGFSFTFPLERGDWVDLHFNERSIEEWLTGGQTEVDVVSDTKYQLTDAKAYAGINPFNDPLEDFPIDRMRLKHISTGAVIDINDDGKIWIGNATYSLLRILDSLLNLLDGGKVLNPETATFLPFLDSLGAPMAPQVQAIVAQLANIME